jgi:hypothetical protein
MRTVLAALVSLFVLSGLPDTPALAASAASGTWLEGHAASPTRVDDDEDDDDKDDDDDDDDDEEFRAIG